MSNGTTLKSVVKISGLHKSFHIDENRIEVLHGLDLDLKEKEFVAVMGASGSGKSTLLHLIAGLTSPDSGSIEVGGMKLGGMSDRELARFRRRRIGLVFQSFNLIPSLSALDNILLPLLMDGEDSAGVVDETLVGMLKLNDRLAHRPGAMSGGEQQRVAIARALVTKPDVVLADEPTGNLDSIATRSLGRLFRELNRKCGTAVIMVTHDSLVASWADRVLFLRDGRIVDEIPAGARHDPSVVGNRYLAVMEPAGEVAR